MSFNLFELTFFQLLSVLLFVLIIFVIASKICAGGCLSNGRNALSDCRASKGDIAWNAFRSVFVADNGVAGET